MRAPQVAREQVLAAARDACRDGHQPTMDELATAAGVSRATLYRLFGSQRELFQELGVPAPAAVRRRLLDTTMELVNRRGLADLPMDELAAAAGVSRATLYRLFPGKPALFAELMRDYSPFESIAATLASAGDRPPAEIVPALGRMIASAMDGRVGLLLHLLDEAARIPPNRGPDQTIPEAGQGDANAWAAASAMGRSVPAITRYLAEQMETGRLRRMDPALAFQALVGPILLHLLTRPLAGISPAASGPVPLEAAVDELATGWLRAMAPDVAPEDASGARH